MQIYTIYNEKLHSLEVKETEHFFITQEYNTGLAWQCRTRIPKDDLLVGRTPLEAVQKAIARMTDTILNQTARLKESKLKLVQLRELEVRHDPSLDLDHTEPR